MTFFLLPINDIVCSGNYSNLKFNTIRVVKFVWADYLLQPVFFNNILKIMSEIMIQHANQIYNSKLEQIFYIYSYYMFFNV